MLKKNDFVEIDFIAKVKETNSVFDTTIPEEAENAGLLHEEKNEKEKEKFKPFKICIGQGMVVHGLDKALENKEIESKEHEKWYEAELLPKDAFGERDSKLVRIIPINAFREKGVEPQAGMMLTLDNLLVRIVSVSSGRVIVDFNNPLAGKVIVYKFRINKKIDDATEKLKILTDFFIGMAEKVNIENGKGIIEFKIKVPDAVQKEFSKKVMEILGLEIEIREAKEEEKELEIATKENGKIRTERPYNE